MMASPSELSLDCKPHNNYSMLLKSFGDQQPDQTQKLEDFLARLEEERLKIDAFKRELPLCMQLLNNAMEASKQQLQSYRANQGQRPVLEEFMPINHSASEGQDQKAPSNISDKANWMTSAQLWSQASDGLLPNNKLAASHSPKDQNDHHIGSPKLGLDTKPRIGGAFLPFTKEKTSCTNQVLPDLALSAASAPKEINEGNKFAEISHEINAKDGIISAIIEQGKGGNGTAEGAAATNGNNNNNHNNNTSSNGQTHRKARRCWSPDLHRRFVNALQMLGGSQVATPKQIRELMKVDGLTNDEVKSHLQKYRLHTRRPSPAPQATGAPAPQLVVLGGIWVPPEYAAAAAHGGASAATIYGAHPTSHAPPPHYCQPPVPQDFYPGPQLHHHHGLRHQQLQQAFKSSPQTAGGSPEPGGDQSESIEDGKSADSGGSGEDGGGERRGLAGLGDDGEESNASQIVLKF